MEPQKDKCTENDVKQIFFCCYNILCNPIITERSLVSDKEREWAYAYRVLIREKETIFARLKNFCY